MECKIPLKEILKPEIWVCAKCGGDLHIHKYIWKKEIKSINWCKNCSPKSGK